MSDWRRPQEDWDAFFLEAARLVSTRSKDPDRRVGAVLVTPDRRGISYGYNGLPADMPDDPALLANRAFKLENVVHAERNCLEQSPFDPAGCTLYVTRFPCLECACLARDRGVRRVVAPRFDRNHPRWGKSWTVAAAALLSAGVEVVEVFPGLLQPIQAGDPTCCDC